MSDSIHYTATETAKFIRRALKKAFKADYPECFKRGADERFSVRATGDVRWVDGPTLQEVRAITQKFQTKQFDGMTDSTYYTPQETPDGTVIHYSIGYISESRKMSASFLEEQVQRITEEFNFYDESGEEVDPDYDIIPESEYMTARIKVNTPCYAVCNSTDFHWSFEQYVYRLLRNTSRTSDAIQEKIDERNEQINRINFNERIDSVLEEAIENYEQK